MKPAFIWHQWGRLGLRWQHWSQENRLCNQLTRLLKLKNRQRCHIFNDNRLISIKISNDVTHLIKCWLFLHWAYLLHSYWMNILSHSGDNNKHEHIAFCTLSFFLTALLKSCQVKNISQLQIARNNNGRIWDHLSSHLDRRSILMCTFSLNKSMTKTQFQGSNL